MPVGAVLSMAKVIPVVTVEPARSAPVTVYAAGARAPAAHVKLLEAYGPPAGVVTVSATWVVHPVALRTGNDADAEPEPASATVATRPKLPAALALK